LSKKLSILGSETQSDSFFWHNLLEKTLYKFGHGLSQAQLLVRPPQKLAIPFSPAPAAEEGDAVDWYTAAKTYLEQEGYRRLEQTLPVGCGTSRAESLRPGLKFELRDAAQPARFWAVTVVENVGGGCSGLLGLGYDSPELRPRTADLRLFYADPRLCPVGTVAASQGKYEFQVGTSHSTESFSFISYNF
jgi:hypothetical protein